MEQRRGIGTEPDPVDPHLGLVRGSADRGGAGRHPLHHRMPGPHALAIEHHRAV